MLNISNKGDLLAGVVGDYSTRITLLGCEGGVGKAPRLHLPSTRSENGELIVIDGESRRLTAYNREGALCGSITSPRD